MAAPAGNQNARKARVWTAAINRALEKRSKVGQVHALDKLANKFITLCMKGDLEALKELGNRIEGKVAQAVVLSQDPDSPLFDTLKRAEELRQQMRVVGHRTEDSQPQYVDPDPANNTYGTVPAEQRNEQVDPE